MTTDPHIAPAAEAHPDFTRLAVFDGEEVSPQIIGRTRKNNVTILQELNSIGAGEVARRMGVHDSSVSRYKNQGGLMYTCRFLASLGLKVVPESAIVYLQPEEYK